jgi:hypothetical protein
METPNIGAALGEAGLKGEGIMVWRTAKGDLELRAEGEEGNGSTVASGWTNQPRCLGARVVVTPTHGRATEMLEGTFSPSFTESPCLDVKASIAERKLACVGRVRVFSVWGRQSNHRE